MLFNNIKSLIGNTPIVKLEKYQNEYKLTNELYAKLEKYNLSGSIKDRASYYMLEKAFEQKLIDKDSTIIEPTSGNTGIALACLGNVFNLNIIIVMPKSMSEERKKIIKDYGAKLELVDGTMNDCIIRAKELKEQFSNSFIPSQFENSNNPLAHYETTGPEILNDLPDVDIVVCGIGTGGTISGVGKYLKEKNSKIKIIGIEPKQSPFITKGTSGKHKIQGIGAGFMPKNLDLNFIDKIIAIDETNAILTAKELNKIEGIYVGISSGAVLAAAKDIAMNEQNKKIVAILPDGGERYSWN